MASLSGGEKTMRISPPLFFDLSRWLLPWAGIRQSVPRSEPLPFWSGRWPPRTLVRVMSWKRSTVGRLSLQEIAYVCRLSTSWDFQWGNANYTASFVEISAHSRPVRPVRGKRFRSVLPSFYERTILLVWHAYCWRQAGHQVNIRQETGWKLFRTSIRHDKQAASSRCGNEYRAIHSSGNRFRMQNQFISHAIFFYAKIIIGKYTYIH